MDAEQTLRSVPLFRGLQQKHLKSLAKGTTQRSYGPDQVILTEGQTGYGLYIIESGRVKVTQQTDSGTRDIRIMGPGESFGELSLLDDRPRSATITALEPTTALLLDKWQFIGEMKSHPEIAMEVLPTVVSWLRDAEMPHGPA